MSRKAFVVLFMAGALALTASSALAHFNWLSLGDHNLKEGAKLKFFVGQGHHFPLEDFAKTDDLTGVTLHDPAGKTSPVAALNDFSFQTDALAQSGAYLLTAAKKPGFFTRTEKGFVRGPKTGQSGVKSCNQSLSFLKAVVNVGEGAGEVSRVVGQELELVPLKNPAALKVGDTLPIKVLFKGQPVPDYPPVNATYAGFENKYAFAHTSSAGKDGITNLRILHNGTWLVMVSVKQPYPDAKECDTVSYTSVLTFEVK